MAWSPSEGRRPKSESRRKPKVRIPNTWWRYQIRIPDFVVRISALLLLLMITDPFSGFSAPTPAPKTNSAAFRVGAATSNITPRLGVSINGYFNDRKAVHIHDELHARC